MVHSKIVITAAALLPCFMLRAQLPPSIQSPSVPVAAAVAVSASVPTSAVKSRVEADKLLASWLMVGCSNELAMARIGVGKAQDVEVRQFAQKMLDAHTQLEAKLLPFAGDDAKGGKSARVPSKDSGDGQDERESAEASSGRLRAAKGEFDHIALVRDLSRRCLEVQTKMLESKTGADFDQGFMQAQVMAHNQAVIMVEVFSNYASGDLRPTLEQAGKTLRAHLEQATALCKKGESVAKAGKSR